MCDIEMVSCKDAAVRKRIETKNLCKNGTCENLESCEIADIGGYKCICPYGTDGRNCEIDTLDECLSSPCRKGAPCENKLGDFECLCPPKWAGKMCEMYDQAYKGWFDRSRKPNCKHI
ncbi:unnamed protein product [Diamesa hyperborea]